jgi:hypothetical protein
MINRFKSIDNKWIRGVNFCLTKEGYIVEFSIDCNEVYNIVERKFFIGPRKDCWKIFICGLRYYL